MSINKIETLAEVGIAIADAYESVDEMASVTMTWVESTFVAVETSRTSDASPNAGLSQTAVD